MGAELGGSRQLLDDLSSGNLVTGGSWHIIKPMMYQAVNQKKKFSYSFMHLITSYFGQNRRPDELPSEVIRHCVNYLKEKGVEKIGLVGMCWGGCVVQHVMNCKKVNIMMLSI